MSKSSNKQTASFTSIVPIELKPEFEPPVIAAWVQLCSRLISIAQGPKAGQEYGNETPGRAEAFGAVAAVVAYLSNCHGLMNEKAIQPLAALLEAMDDLQKGRKPQLLAPSPAANRPPASQRRSRMIGLSARCLDDLIKSGVKEDDAAKRVVAALKTGRAIDHTSTTTSKIKNWRNKCNAASGDVSRDAIAKFNDTEVLGWAINPADRGEIILTILSQASDRMLDG